MIGSTELSGQLGPDLIQFIGQHSRFFGWYEPLLLVVLVCMFYELGRMIGLRQKGRAFATLVAACVIGIGLMHSSYQSAPKLWLDGARAYERLITPDDPASGGSKAAPEADLVGRTVSYRHYIATGELMPYAGPGNSEQSFVPTREEIAKRNERVEIKASLNLIALLLQSSRNDAAILSIVALLLGLMVGAGQRLASAGSVA